MPDAKAGLLDRIARLHQVFNFQVASPDVKLKIYLGMLKEMFFMLQKIPIQDNDLKDIENGLAIIQHGFYSFLQGKEKERLDIDLNAHMDNFIGVRSHFLAASSSHYRNYMELQLSRHGMYNLCKGLHYPFEIPSSNLTNLDRCNKNLKKMYDTLVQIERIRDSDLEKMKNNLLILDNAFYTFLERKRQPSGIAFHNEIYKFFLVRSYFQGALLYEIGTYDYHKHLLDCQYALFQLLEALLFVWP